jgi:phytoene dehydrogenase-like protein
VVSLLRPEIIRELDLRRHGLEILPLDGTFTPASDGRHLWRVDDHETSRRAIARHSTSDADVYETFCRAMVAMARFVRPLLDMTPPDPLTRDPRELMKLGALAARFRGLSGEERRHYLQLMTMSAANFWISG